MVRSAKGILLTGATGFLGRYLLRDLLLAGHRVTVLARAQPGARAAQRVQEVVDFWSQTLGQPLPEPSVVSGDLHSEQLGLNASGRSRLALDCDCVIHAAAHLALRPSPSGEPWATNAAGMRHLLACCRSLGISEFHHVSTAYVCGRSAGPILEDDTARKRRFRNAYEESKWDAEELLRATSGIQTTSYRPAVLVGDSRTGYTSTNNGLYRFLKLVAHLAHAPSGLPKRLELPLPLTGDEQRNLVPVDWVAQAIVRLLDRPACHGRVYHLTSPAPVPLRLIMEVAQKVPQLEGVRFAGPGVLAAQTPLEQFFLDQLEDYWPYLDGDPEFDHRNLDAALPDFPAVVVDRPLLTRLMQFAVSDRWEHGRRESESTPRSGTSTRSLLGAECL